MILASSVFLICAKLSPVVGNSIGISPALVEHTLAEWHIFSLLAFIVLFCVVYFGSIVGCGHIGLEAAGVFFSNVRLRAVVGSKMTTFTSWWY